MLGYEITGYSAAEYATAIPPIDLVQKKQTADLASFSEYLQAVRTHQPEALLQNRHELASTIYWDWFQRPRDVWTLGATEEDSPARASLSERQAYLEEFSDDFKAAAATKFQIFDTYIPDIGNGLRNDRPVAYVDCNISPAALPCEASALFADLNAARIDAYMETPVDPVEAASRKDNVSIVTDDRGLMRLMRVLASRQQSSGVEVYRPELPKFSAPVRGLSATEALVGVSLSTENDVNTYRGSGELRCIALADAVLQGAVEVADFDTFFASEEAIEEYGLFPGCLALNASNPRAFQQLLPLTKHL